MDFQWQTTTDATSVKITHTSSTSGRLAITRELRAFLNLKEIKKEKTIDEDNHPFSPKNQFTKEAKKKMLNVYITFSTMEATEFW